MKKSKTSKEKPTPKKDKARKTIPKSKSICKKKVDQSASNVSEIVCVSGLLNLNETQKRFNSSNGIFPDPSKHSNISDSKKSKTQKIKQDKSKFVIKFKKDATIKSHVNRTKSTIKTCEKLSSSLITKVKDDFSNNPDGAVSPPKVISISKDCVGKQKCEDPCFNRGSINGFVACNEPLKNPANLKKLNSGDDFAQMAEVCANTQQLTVVVKEPPKKKRGRRKSKDVSLPNADYSDTNNDISFSNATPLKTGAKRWHNLDGPHTSLKKKKPVEECLNELNIPSKHLSQTVHLKKDRTRSKSVLQCNTSRGIQPMRALETETVSQRDRRAFNRQTFKDIEPSGENLGSQIIETKLQNKFVDRCESEYFSSTRVVTPRIQSENPLDEANVIRTSDSAKTQDSNLEPGSSVETTSDVIILNSDSDSDKLLEYEEILWGSDSDETHEDHTKESQPNKLSLGDDPLVELKKEVQRPNIELTIVPKYSYENLEANGISVESMLTSPTPPLNNDESKYTFTDNQSVLLCEESSPVKECNVLIERLSPQNDQTKINCVNNRNLPKIKNASHSERKQTLSFRTSNSCFDVVKDIIPNKTLRPKLTKSSILKRTEKRTFLKTKPIMIANEHENELERTVAFTGDKPNITSMKITKRFSDEGFKDTKNISLETEKKVTNPSCTEKQSLLYMPIPKNNDIFSSFTKEISSHKVMEESPPNDALKRNLYQETNLRSEISYESEEFKLLGSSEANKKLQHPCVFKQMKRPITFDEGFNLPSSNHRDQKSRTRTGEVQKSQECAKIEQNIKSVIGAKGIASNKKNIHQKIGKVENCRVETLVQTVDKVAEKPISPKQSRRNIVFHDNKFQNVANNNLPSCSTNNRSFQDNVSDMDFSFPVPKGLPKKVVQTPVVDDGDDDDDMASVMSLFVSDELINDVENDGVAKKNTTLDKFDRYSKNSDDDDNGGDITRPIKSSHNSYVKSDVVHLSKINVNEDGEKTYSTNPSRIEKCYLWNQQSENFSNTDYASPRQTISPQENGNNRIFDDPTKFSQHSIKDYCFLYLRMSIVSHYGCNLIHKVPFHLFSCVGNQDVEKVDSEINEIIANNFSNPPEGLVSVIVSCCVKLSKRTTLVRLGKCLKHVNKDNASRLWITFLKAIMDSKYYNFQNTQKCRFISTILDQIFKERTDFSGEDVESLMLIQSALIEVHGHFRSELKLLMCLGFMFEKDRLNLRFISPEFAISVVKQCMDEVKNKPDKPWIINYIFKVASSLFFDFNFVEILYNYDKYSVLTFTQMVESRKVVDWSSRNYKIKELLIANGYDKPSLESRKCSPLSYDSNMRSNIATIHHVTDSVSVRAALERSYDKGELDPKEVFNCLKPSFKKEIFLCCLSSLRGDVKEALSDVIMSFISQEANDQQWANCYKLFKSLSHWDFKAVKNLDECNSPTSNVLNIVRVLLMNQKITEAINLFCEYHLWEHEEDWILDYIPADIETSKNICSIIQQQVNKLEEDLVTYEDLETLSSITIRIISLQDTLATPINLIECVGKLICRLVEARQYANIVLLLSRIFDDGKSKLLTLPHVDFYRALVVIICNEKNLKLAAMFFFKAMDRVELYPTIPKPRTGINPNKEMCIELYSNLRNEELKVIVFVVLRLFGTIIKNSGFFVKFKRFYGHYQRVIPEYLKPLIVVQDSSVPCGIKRFKDIVRELIPNALFILREDEGIGIDKISLKEYVHSQNNQAM